MAENKAFHYPREMVETRKEGCKMSLSPAQAKERESNCMGFRGAGTRLENLNTIDMPGLECSKSSISDDSPTCLNSLRIVVLRHLKTFVALFTILFIITVAFSVVLILVSSGKSAGRPGSRQKSDANTTIYDLAPEKVNDVSTGKTIVRDYFGKTATGVKVYRYTMRNGNGVQLQVMTLGGAITSLRVPDKYGNFDDVVLGFDTLEEFDTDDMTDNPYFGVTVGRVCNRIRGGTFTLPRTGGTYHASRNERNNTLHGGKRGFNRYVWDGVVKDNQVVFNMTSPDGDEGFPGEVKVQVTYELTDDNEVSIDFRATTSRDTPINLCNHAYYNLAGQGSGTSVAKYEYMVNALYYTEVDEQLIPTGTKADVENTDYDLRSPTQLLQLPIMTGGGFDVNYCLFGASGMKRAAMVRDNDSGRVLEVFTNQPGLQFYTGGGLNTRGKGGANYTKYTGFAMETQNYPDALNQYPNFPSSILTPGSLYHHRVVYKFSVSNPQ